MISTVYKIPWVDMPIWECTEELQKVFTNTGNYISEDLMKLNKSIKKELREPIDKDKPELTKMLAERKNSGKPQLSYIDLKCFEDCAKVMEFGAKKYARNNWKKGMPQTQLIDSLLRHVAQLLSGEEFDQESGLSHIGHIQCNSMFLGNPNNVKDLTSE